MYLSVRQWISDIYCPKVPYIFTIYQTYFLFVKRFLKINYMENNFDVEMAGEWFAALGKGINLVILAKKKIIGLLRN